MSTCSEEISQGILGAIVEAEKEQSKGTISWVSAIPAGVTISESTGRDLKLKPPSPQEIKEKKNLDPVISSGQTNQNFI